jgi:AcrR family transcriptional regulator
VEAAIASAGKSSRKERERQQHRQEILSAALQLFAEKGFHNVSMQEVAAAAEFATGTLYNFFSSKEDLFFELLLVTAEESLRVILPALEGHGNERDRLSRFIRVHARIVREQATALRLYLLEVRGRYLPGPRIEAKKKEIDARIIGPLSHLIAAGVRSGQFNEIDPVVGAKCLMATLQTLIIAAVEDLPANDLDADLEKIETIFFNGIVKSREQECDA